MRKGWKVPRWIHVPWFVVVLTGLIIMIASDPLHGWRPVWRYGWFFGSVWYWVFGAGLLAWNWFCSFGRLR